MEENAKERIREILDDLLNFKDRDLNEKDIYILSKIKNELKTRKINMENEIQSKKNSGISMDDESIKELEINLKRIGLAFEYISEIVSESVIILSGKNDGNFENGFENIEENNCNINIEENLIKENENDESVNEKLEKRKQIKDPLEAFFISYSSANELMKTIRKELKDEKNEN